ncbi:hypothetical protein M2480_002364 [Parabacteroides sp. PFB2-12]|nr:hypothetical protein [Parabacteroides sp. PM6-13]MDH6391369.1 hypothetical protein [Parabacteroides sp. PFB2-12]
MKAYFFENANDFIEFVSFDKIGCVSAIQASLIALNFHYLCRYYEC